MKDLKTRNKFIKLRGKGYSFDKISKLLKVSKPTLISWQRAFDEDISRLKLVNQEALLEKYKLKKRHKIRQLGKVLKKAGEELQKRDFSDIPTPKLIEILIKSYDYLERLTENIKHVEPETNLSDQIRDFASRRKEEFTLVAEE